MIEDAQKAIFQKNLLRYLGDKSQVEVAKAIDVSPQTFNTWCQGIAIPRMDKIQKLADYFMISMADLIEEHSKEEESLTERHLKAFSQLPEDQQKLVEELIETLRIEPENTDKIVTMIQNVLSFFCS